MPKGAESRHNIGYWKSHDWLGIGPGAHGQYWAGSVNMPEQAQPVRLA